MNATANQQVVLKNHLFAALPADDFARLQPKLEQISFELGEVLYESGDRLDYAYFPTTDYFDAVYYGKRRNRRNRRGGQRRNSRNGIVYGRRHDDQPGDYSERGRGFQNIGKGFENRICAGRRVSKVAVALHAGVDDADFTNRCL